MSRLVCDHVLGCWGWLYKKGCVKLSDKHKGRHNCRTTASFSLFATAVYAFVQLSKVTFAAGVCAFPLWDGKSAPEEVWSSRLMICPWHDCFTKAGKQLCGRCPVLLITRITSEHFYKTNLVVNEQTNKTCRLISACLPATITGYHRKKKHRIKLPLVDKNKNAQKNRYQ